MHTQFLQSLQQKLWIFTQIYLHIDHDFYGLITLAFSGTGTGTETWTGGCVVLCRTFHTTPEQGQGPTCIVPNCSGSCPSPCPGTGHSQCDYTITSLVYDSYVRSKRPKPLLVMMKRAVRWRDYSNRTTTSAQWSHRWGRRWRRLVLSSQAAANQRAGNKTRSQQVRNDYPTTSTLFCFWWRLLWVL